MEIDIIKGDKLSFNFLIENECMTYIVGENCELFREECEKSNLPCLTDIVISIIDSRGIKNVSWGNADDDTVMFYALAIISQAVV